MSRKKSPQIENVSMMPLILPGDKPIIDKAKKFFLEDIICFEKNDKLIAHRIIYADPRKKFFLTKGDNGRRADGKVYPARVLGKVSKIKRSRETIYLEHVCLSQSSVYLKELKKIAKSFRTKKISHLFLKGLPLHLWLNNTPPRRIFIDADILIGKKDSLQALKILKKQGFKEEKQDIFDKGQGNHPQITLVKKTKPFEVVIDLHFEPAIGLTKLDYPNRLIPNRGKYTQHLLKNFRKVRIDNQSFPILKEEALFIYLLLHLFHHNFRGAHRLNLINDLAKNKKLNWERTKDIILEFNFQNFVYLPILLLEKYYHTSFPDEFKRKIKPFPLTAFLSKFLLHFINPFDSDTRRVAGVKRFIYLVCLSPSGFLEKIKVLANKQVVIFYFATISSFFRNSSTNSSKSLEDLSWPIP